MTDHTDEELKLIVLRSSGRYSIPDVSYSLLNGEAILTPMQLRAFASTLRQQDLARMARMREALNKAQQILLSEHTQCPHDDDFYHYECPVCSACSDTKQALSETSDIQEWLDGQREAVPDGWILDKAHVNDIQEKSIAALINRAGQAHFVDVKVRVNGEWETYQADWIKHMRLTAPSARSTKGEG